MWHPLISRCCTPHFNKWIPSLRKLNPLRSIGAPPPTDGCTPLTDRCTLSSDSCIPQFQSVGLTISFSPPLPPARFTPPIRLLDPFAPVVIPRMATDDLLSSGPGPPDTDVRRLTRDGVEVRIASRHAEGNAACSPP